MQSYALITKLKKIHNSSNLQTTIVRYHFKEIKKSTLSMVVSRGLSFKNLRIFNSKLRLQMPLQEPY